jgi:hypothetical protein
VQPECASRQNSLDHRRPIFFIAAQPVDAYREIRPDYDGWSSGPIIYAYVGGNPVSEVDPDGLQVRPSLMPQGTIYNGTGDIAGQIWIGNQMRDGAIRNYNNVQRKAEDAWGPRVTSVCLVSVTNVPQKPYACSAANPTGAASLPTTGPVMSTPGQGTSTCLQWGLTVGQ